jgi:hypothetical protein
LKHVGKSYISRGWEKCATGMQFSLIWVLMLMLQILV